MAETTGIAWCDSTFNPWIGCTKVSPGCDNCYAKADFEDRKHRVIWGAGQARSRTKTWGDPVKWSARPFFECAECSTDCRWRGECDGESCPICGGHVVPARRRVFCASLADVFDNEVDREWRDDLATLILDTPSLDWLLLTKRIGNAGRMLGEMFLDGPPDNVCLGATIVNQEEADRDIPKLLATPAAVRFLSMEPLLGPVDLNYAFGIPSGAGKGSCPMHLAGVCPEGLLPLGKQHLHWVIVGGESGPGARPMHPDWARSLRDQCAAAGVPLHFKQWGEWVPMMGHVEGVPVTGPKFTHPDGTIMGRAGKKAAGRLLDGVEHNGFPEVTA